jgi:hypothetical protein
MFNKKQNIRLSYSFDNMTKTSWWSTVSDSDGKTYYFKRDSRGKAHRVSKDMYQSHILQDVPQFEEDGTTPTGPRYWTVGTRGKNGENDFIVMRKVSGDSNVYTLDPKDIHGDLQHDVAAMKRIGSIIDKHKATLRATDPRAEIPQEVTYNLNSTTFGTPNIMSRVMSIPTISADALNDAAAFNSPYATILLNNLKYINIPTSALDRRKCMNLEELRKNATSFFTDKDNSFGACQGDNCDFVLTVQEYDEQAYKTMEYILTSNMKDMYPPLKDHWDCQEERKSFWLFDVRGLKKLNNNDLDNAEKQTNINKQAKELVDRSIRYLIFLGKQKDELFNINEFLQKSDGTLVFWNCCNTALYKAKTGKVDFPGKSTMLTASIIGNWTEALQLNNEAIEKGVQKYTEP